MINEAIAEPINKRINVVYGPNNFHGTSFPPGSFNIHSINCTYYCNWNCKSKHNGEYGQCSVRFIITKHKIRILVYGNYFIRRISASITLPI